MNFKQLESLSQLIWISFSCYKIENKYEPINFHLKLSTLRKCWIIISSRLVSLRTIIGELIADVCQSICRCFCAIR